MRATIAKKLQIESCPARAPGEKSDLLHAVQRALLVLSLVAEHPQGLTAREISHALGINISTCYHILNTLAASGYLDRQPHNQVYLLGPQIPFLNNAFVQSLASQEVVPPLEDTTWSTGFLAPSLVERLRSLMYHTTVQTQERSYIASFLPD